jgi:hypothetical protein
LGDTEKFYLQQTIEYTPAFATVPGNIRIPTQQSEGTTREQKKKGVYFSIYDITE